MGAVKSFSKDPQSLSNCFQNQISQTKDKQILMRHQTIQRHSCTIEDMNCLSIYMKAILIFLTNTKCSSFSWQFFHEYFMFQNDQFHAFALRKVIVVENTDKDISVTLLK